MNDAPEDIPTKLHEQRGANRSDSLTTFLKFVAFVAIAGLVGLMLLPAQRTAREAARRNSCMNNLKQIALALHNYESANGAYPPAYTVDADGRPLHSWRTLILPFMEQQRLYEQIELTKPWDDPANKVAYDTMPEVYRCPSDPTDNADKRLTTYLAVVTPGSVIRAADSLSHADLTAPSEALLAVDAAPSQAVHWMAPVDADENLLLNVDPKLKRQHNGDICLAAYADGHVSALHKTIDGKALRAMITASADDNEALQSDD